MSARGRDHDGPIRVAVAGVTGWVGRPLAQAVTEADGLELVAGVARSAAGGDLGRVVSGEPSGVPVRATVEEAVASTRIDVLVDYTHPGAVLGHVLTCMGAGVDVVIGTSGLRSEDFTAIDDRARGHGRGVFAAGNFSMLAATLEYAALLAARSADAWEVIDYAGPAKPDAPSGTARQIADRLGAARAAAVPVADTVGATEARGADIGGVQVHSLRLPGFTLSTEVVLATAHERLVLRHDSTPAPDPYLEGTLLAVRRVGTWVGLVRGLDRLLFTGQPHG